MAWRFQDVSKFRNTCPTMPRKEDCVYDLPVGAFSSSGNCIDASDIFTAFKIDGDGGGKLGILPLEARGRRLRKDLNVLCAHSGTIADFAFSPFCPTLLATCTRDEDAVKIWSLNHNFLSSTPKAAAQLNTECGVECLSFHPCASQLLALGTGHRASIWDVDSNREAFALAQGTDRVQSCGWHGDGKLLATFDKSQMLRCFDPRQHLSPTHETRGPEGVTKESRVLFLGSESKVLVSGFTKTRCREIMLFDLAGDFKKPYKTLQLDSSTNVMIPLYDADTRLLYLAGKGSAKVSLYEVLDKPPVLLEGATFTGETQLQGACLVPKSALNVMQAEVSRVLCLTSSSIVPISYKVPRKSYRDFHTDLYVDATCSIAGLSAAEWLAGDDRSPPRFSLDPSKRHLIEAARNNSLDGSLSNGAHVNGHSESSSNPSSEMSPVKSEDELNTSSSSALEEHTSRRPVAASPPTTIETKVRKLSAGFDHTDGEATSRPVRTGVPIESVKPKATWPPAADKPPSPSKVVERPAVPVRRTIASTITTEERKSQVAAPLTHKPSLRTQFAESCGFGVSRRWCAISLDGTQGLVLILDLNKHGKIPDGVLQSVVETRCTSTDIEWDPFNPNRLAVGCENGTVQLFDIPPNGIFGRSLDEPTVMLQGHRDKVVIVRHHPLAESVLATASVDGSILIWDTKNNVARITLESHPQAVQALCWSYDGLQLATLCKDKYLRVFRPLQATGAILSASVLDSMRGGRVSFVCADRMILVTGFSRSSERVVKLVNTQDLRILHSVNIDSNPQLLLPYYDYDTSVVFLTAKGDRIVRVYEVVAQAPYMLECSHFDSKSKTGHQAIAMQSKIACDVKKVEFARVYRLELSDVEFVSFTVPRKDMDHFQHDIFPPAYASWEPVLTADEFFAGAPCLPKFVSLRPTDMATSSLTNGSATNSASPCSIQPALKEPQSAQRESVIPTSVHTSPSERVLQEANIVANDTAAHVRDSESTGQEHVVPDHAVPLDALQSPAMLFDDGVVSGEPKSIEQAKKELVGGIYENLTKYDGDRSLPQDNVDGVDEHEWHET